MIITFLIYNPVFSQIIKAESELAYKYCDSLEKKLFEGLTNEKILKSKYFSNSLEGKLKKNKFKFEEFENQVNYLCDHKFSVEEKLDFYSLLEKYL